MMKKHRLIPLLGAVLLAVGAAACERSPMQTEAPIAPRTGPAWDLGTDSINIDTGYFGSGHYSPPDTLLGEPPG
jgi:hypothetical protein